MKKSSGRISPRAFLAGPRIWLVSWAQDRITGDSASATALFSANALGFMPVDGLAYVAEYTSKKMIPLLCLSG